ncbi:PREDICTED: uncharacterized protein LOC109151076 [Ipomoea nil]|uniref:uncharacterized protein LOC109151076 n=1 Tax=Ipomoea nil TaxID=35883 RepID=UPI00090164E5|nr:PREDICTED: uncharacterized protein LOC109151076 [Ipomoea nil]
MERVSIKPACFLLLFMVASLLPSSLMAQISVGPNKKQLFMTGQLCKSHDDCKANSVYSTNFCINKISGSEMGHCVGFGSTLVLASETKKSKAILGCGKCETDADCRDCPATAGCEKIILDGYCA